MARRRDGSFFGENGHVHHCDIGVKNTNPDSAALLSSGMRRRRNKFSRMLSASLMLTLLVILLANVQGAWIDEDTPKQKRTTKSLVDGTTYNLVMSDEFNVPNRTFKDGHDTMWTSLDKSDDDFSASGAGSLHFYNSTQVTTENGMLKISTVIAKTEWNRYDHVDKKYKHEVKHYKSGMVQSWNKFCFTGGIVEFDVKFPGDPHIGGLWPAVWMLGNLGRSTYEASTNNIWPWSYNKCNRQLQEAQRLSACNAQNHFGMLPYQGRGATEIDIVEVMSGNSGGPLPNTVPPVGLPYADMTLQIAPGVWGNRPQPGFQPSQYYEQMWYKGLELQGNTSINPYFYGTYLAETKKDEPVARNAKQAFQADAVGVMHQLGEEHFQELHTFRLEWQPGPGGRLDWYAKKKHGSGGKDDWVHTLSIKDESLSSLLGSQIPIEPTYLIMNTAVSSTWGFPYSIPPWCTKCYDCNNATCGCAIGPGFCQMLKKGDVAMHIDYVRVYQSPDPDSHVGANHTLGCDPPGYPTREYINGHAQKYVRMPPFGYKDPGPLRHIVKGNGRCHNDTDCGGSANDDGIIDKHGRCIFDVQKGIFGGATLKHKTCKCFDGYTGPFCLAIEHKDESESVFLKKSNVTVMEGLVGVHVTPLLSIITLTLIISFVILVAIQVNNIRSDIQDGMGRNIPASPGMGRPQFVVSESSNLVVTGRSV